MIPSGVIHNIMFFELKYCFNNKSLVRNNNLKWGSAAKFWFLFKQGYFLRLFLISNPSSLFKPFTS